MTVSRLELKIPPPVVAVICLALAWVLARFTPEFTFVFPGRIPLAIILALIGFSLALSGVIAFRRARTTVNPHTPQKSTAIVSSGPFARTRNPMYLGMVVVLISFGVYLANPMAIVAVVVFVTYISRFQIIPEERLLRELFGEPYTQYTKSVRRWL